MLPNGIDVDLGERVVVDPEDRQQVVAAEDREGGLREDQRRQPPLGQGRELAPVPDQDGDGNPDDEKDAAPDPEGDSAHAIAGVSAPYWTGLTFSTKKRREIARQKQEVQGIRGSRTSRFEMRNLRDQE